MNQDYYQYIYHFHEKQLEIDRINAALRGTSPKQTPLRKWFLLSMSDALFGLGRRIRPVEFQVDIQVSQSNEGSLEIKAGGC